MSLVEITLRRSREGKETWSAFFDLRKAYDMVPHDLLLEKVKAKQFGPKFFNMVRGVYKSTQGCVRIRETVGDPFDIERGVRQGCPLSPILFDILIDDLLDKMTPLSIPGISESKFKGMLFADDTLLVADSPEDLQCKINLVSDWMAQNGMELNVAKSGIIVFPNSGNEIAIKYREQEVPRVE
ncbi:hypothetical protein NUSPORA_01206 [Nucleospora cyclopteri]